MSTPDSTDLSDPVEPAPEAPVVSDAPASLPTSEGWTAADPVDEPEFEAELMVDDSAASVPVPVAEPEPEPEPLAPVLDAIAELRAHSAESQRLLERQIEIASRLHAENQTLRAGELRQAQQGLVASVLRVFDDLRHMAATAADAAGQRDLALAADALADALERNGVGVSPIEVGEVFDPKRHKIASVRSTADADANRTVSEVTRPGFAWSDGTVVRVAEVVVFKHDPAASSDDGTSE